MHVDGAYRLLLELITADFQRSTTLRTFLTQGGVSLSPEQVQASAVWVMHGWVQLRLLIQGAFLFVGELCPQMSVLWFERLFDCLWAGLQVGALGGVFYGLFLSFSEGFERGLFYLTWGLRIEQRQTGF